MLPRLVLGARDDTRSMAGRTGQEVSRLLQATTAAQSRGPDTHHGATLPIASETYRPHSVG